MAAGVRGGGRVPPRKVFVVELDVRKVAGLEVCRPVARFGTHDRTAFDADDVARAEEGDIARHGVGQRTAIDPLAGNLHVDMRGRPQTDRRIEVCRRDRVGNPLPQVRQKRVRPQWAHAATSNAGITWSVSARLGSAATVRDRKSAASARLVNDAATLNAWLFDCSATVNVSVAT